MRCFNPRAPCGARPLQSLAATECLAFQSTRPVRGATFFYALFSTLPEVSIHAPRAGRDTYREKVAEWIVVSIHAPRAGRDLNL